MKVCCPECDKPLSAADMNVAKDVAVCPECNEAFAISAIVSPDEYADDEFDLRDPPRGVRFEDTGIGWRLTSTTRSPVAFFLVPFMCVWSGFSLGGIYGTQIAQGEFNPLLSLFGLPFLIGTGVLGTIAVMTVCGKVVVSVERGEGKIFSGVGTIGWTRRVDWDSIRSVKEESLGYRHSGGDGLAIALLGPSRLKFGSLLTHERRYFLVQALRRLLATRER